MRSRPDLSVIIINYRSVAFTKVCLQTLYDTAGDLKLEVIVVDNASFDGCGEMLRACFPQVVFVQSDKNHGFAGANNLGVRRSTAETILFLNPDTEIRNSALQTLFAALNSIPNAGLVGARLLNSDLTIQTTSITAFPSLANQLLGSEYLRVRFPKARLWGMKPLFESHHTPVAVDAISGACMMGKRDVVEQVAGFTESYFMYSEDLDLCLKVKQTGRTILYVPDAVIVHHGGKSSGNREESSYADIMIRESVFQFMSVHRGKLYAWTFRLLSTAAAIARTVLLSASLAVSAVRGNPKAAVRRWRKWLDILGWCIGARSWAQRERVSAN